MSESVWLIYNFGTQEPRIRCGDDFWPLKDKDRPAVRRTLERAGVDWRLIGLWARAKDLLPSQDKFEFRFPILLPAIQFAQKQGELLKVKIIATDATSRDQLSDDDPRLDDTKYAATLARNWLIREQGIREDQVEIVELEDDNPHFYDNAKRALHKKRLLDGLPGDVKVLVCCSPGLPAVNSAVLQQVLHGHSSRCVAFQIDHPNEKDLIAGDSGRPGDAGNVAETEIFLDLAIKQLKTLVSKFEYESALALLDEIPVGPKKTKERVSAALVRAHKQWRLDQQYLEDLSGVAGWERPYLLRTYASLRVAEALLEKFPDDAIAWYGDTYEYFRDVLYVILMREPYLMRGQDLISYKRAHCRPGLDWLTFCSQAFSAFWDDLVKLHAVQSVRNSFVHRLETRSVTEIEGLLLKERLLRSGEHLDKLPAIFENRIDQAIKVCCLGDPKEMKVPLVSFPKLNSGIYQLIHQDLELGRTE